MAAKRTASRAEWGGLTREAVIDTALEVLQAEGMSGLSIRSVARRLEVSPMALYRHVASKDDLLDEVVDLLFADRWRPEVPEDDWVAWIEDAADRMRRFLVEQPAALHVYLRHPVMASTAALRMDTCLALLCREIGDARARQAFAAVQSYTIGFAALEAARESAKTRDLRPEGVAHDDPDGTRARELSSYASPTQFRAGLHYLLRGVVAD